MKAVTFTVKLTESNIELLQEFKENKQLGLLIRTYFDALACDRGGTLANLIGLSGGDVVRNSITATGVVANHYKSYLEAGLKDKIDRDSWSFQLSFSDEKHHYSLSLNGKTC